MLSPRKAVQADTFLRFALNTEVLSNIQQINDLFKMSPLDAIMISVESEMTTTQATCKTFTKGVLVALFLRAKLTH